jgi:hypothetical protein
MISQISDRLFLFNVSFISILSGWLSRSYQIQVCNVVPKNPEELLLCLRELRYGRNIVLFDLQIEQWRGVCRSLQTRCDLR